MPRFVAFLRGMNLGRRRIANDALCAHFVDLGFERVSAFLASGNVIFDANSSARLTQRIERELAKALEYDVPTFLRTADEVRRIAETDPIGGEGKLQVALLGAEPTVAARGAVMELSDEADRLAVDGRELYWLPEGNLSDSCLDMDYLVAQLGPMTVRTHRTIRRLVPKLDD